MTRYDHHDRYDQPMAMVGVGPALNGRITPYWHPMILITELVFAEDQEKA